MTNCLPPQKPTKGKVPQTKPGKLPVVLRLFLLSSVPMFARCVLHWHRCWLFVLLLANGVCMEDPLRQSKSPQAVKRKSVIRWISTS
eukprot:2921638-Amphidinium_carterae.1